MQITMSSSQLSSRRKRAAAKEQTNNTEEDNGPKKKPTRPSQRRRKEQQVLTQDDATSQSIIHGSGERLTGRFRNRQDRIADQSLRETSNPTNTVLSAAQLTSSFFDQPCLQLARNLLGKRIIRILEDGCRLVGKIVETEAYAGAEDRGSLTFGGRRTPSSEGLYMAPGTAHVHTTYGMYAIINISSRGVPAFTFKFWFQSVSL